MKPLYLLMGLLAGGLLATMEGLHQIDLIEQIHEKDAFVYVLTGYGEGMVRGMEYKEKMMRWQMGLLNLQLIRCYEGKETND